MQKKELLKALKRVELLRRRRELLLGRTGDEYLSDPNKPVPYVGQVAMRVVNTYMTEDQRFAAARPDVLVYKTDVLDRDITVLGPISVDLKVSTTGLIARSPTASRLTVEAAAM